MKEEIDWKKNYWKVKVNNQFSNIDIRKWCKEFIQGIYMGYVPRWKKLERNLYHSITKYPLIPKSTPIKVSFPLKVKRVLSELTPRSLWYLFSPHVEFSTTFIQKKLHLSTTSNCQLYP